MRLIFSFLLWSLSYTSYGQKIISGNIKDAETGELIIGANIKSISEQAVSNKYGYYNIYVLKSDSLIVSFIGYKTKVVINITSHELNIELEQSTQSLDEITVYTTPKTDPNEEISTIKISNLDIKNMPALVGEKDLIKTIQMLPGVQKGTEGTTALQVRGGGRDQNLILLDDAVVYNANHLFGFFSVFNTDAVKNIVFQKGGFDPKYGGRLSSVVDITTKEGSNKSFKLEGGIGLLSSRLLVEGPIIKEKLSFLFSGRRSYIDPILSLISRGQSSKTNYRMYDFNTKLGYIFNKKNAIYLSAYQGDDKFKNSNFEVETKKLALNNIQWGNKTYSLRWTNVLTSKSFLSAIVSNSNFRNNITDKVSNEQNDILGEEIINSGIIENTAKVEIQNTIYKNLNHVGGLFYTNRLVEPDFYKLKSENIDNNKLNISTFRNIETGTYQQLSWSNSSYTLNVGVRALSFTTEDKLRFLLEPRLNIAYKIKSTFLKAFYSKSNQFINQLATSNLGLPTDIWVPTTQKFLPSSSEMIGIGHESKIGNMLLLSSELYFKTLNNIFQFKEGVEIFEFGGPEGKYWESRLVQGDGISYGLEILLSKKIGKFKGWASYTLSRTVHRFNEVNNSKPFYPFNDRTHDLSLTASNQLNKKLKFTTNWVLTSGARTTAPIGLYNYLFSPFKEYAKRDIASYYGNKNSGLLPIYHRLDLGIEILGKQKKKMQGSWEFGFYNAYYRKNPYSFTLNRKIINGNTNVFTLKYDYLLPIVPYINYNFKI